MKQGALFQEFVAKPSVEFVMKLVDDSALPRRPSENCVFTPSAGNLRLDNVVRSHFVPHLVGMRSPGYFAKVEGRQSLPRPVLPAETIVYSLAGFSCDSLRCRPLPLLPH